MKLSYNWLIEYVEATISPKQVAEILTDTGLEVEGLEKWSSVPGGLQGLVIGEVIEKTKHPNADKLSLTNVDIGTGQLLSIVCGAPNVDAGQKVIVAPVGTIIHPTTGEPFKIKEAKIRGELSQGMICAEDEIGLGEEHDGIMVLEPNAEVGKSAADHLEIATDWTFEIGLTPNRTDGMSHIGAARDLVAAIKRSQDANWHLPEFEFIVDNTSNPITVVVEDTDACPRYAGVTISGVKVQSSPAWLQNKLKAIGLTPINNVVDATNFVLHELGQPLHAFDKDKIAGNKVVVKKLDSGTKFTTLDEVERELHEEDLIICDAESGMCIAGVFGGIHSGVSSETTNIFLESAYFDPVHVRKTAKRHALNTDASFRFERGVDPNNTVFALKRAALLIKELAGGEISSDISDTHPEPFPHFEVELSLANCSNLIGAEIPKADMVSILSSLDIEVEKDCGGMLSLKVPPYRADVQREADVIEEILRIYGYNNVDLPGSISMALSTDDELDKEQVINRMADLLTANGYYEIMCNSLTSVAYNEKLVAHDFDADNAVIILNPLSSELGQMRQTMLYGGLEAIARNQNHQNPDLKLFEFGKVYGKNEDCSEGSRLAIFVTGRKSSERWNSDDSKSDFFELKGILEAVISSLGLLKNYSTSYTSGGLFAEGLQYEVAKQAVASMGTIRSDVQKHFGIKQAVHYLEVNLDALYSLLSMNKVKYTELPKYPTVRRDLSLLLDASITFSQLENAAKKVGGSLLKTVGLFDVYEGDKLPTGKKSYALDFHLLDVNATLTDEVVDGVMSKIQNEFENQFSATLR